MYEKLKEYVNNADWTNAIAELKKEFAQDHFDVELAVLAATIFFANGSIEQARKAISRGLSLDSKNYELWLLLGQTYAPYNVNQSYLCYENALFYCDVEDDAVVIREFMEMTRQVEGFSVTKTAFVILSYNHLDYTKGCIESIHATCPESAYEICIVDNNSAEKECVEWLRKQPDIKLQVNDYNAGFPGGCNQGIALAEKDSDIFLLNNDTIMCENSLFWLRMGLYENDGVGATGSISNYVSNLQQAPFRCDSPEEYVVKGAKNNLPMDAPYEHKIYLVGFAVLIKRAAIDEINNLDERFFPGTYEDNDLGLKLRNAGWDVLLCRNSFIFHYGSGGGSNTKKWDSQYSVNEQKLDEKWGFRTVNYLFPNRFLARGLSTDRNREFNVLEINCGLGASLLFLKSFFPNIHVFGVEKDEKLCDIASNYLEVVNGDIGNQLPFEEKSFDYVLFGIGRLRIDEVQPVINWAQKYLKEDGVIITDANIPRFMNRDEELLKKYENKLAICIFTHNHPDVVKKVALSAANIWYEYGIDVYYYDSSESNDTKEVIDMFIELGYDNLFYKRIDGAIFEKMSDIISGGLNKSYQYVLPSKDRSYYDEDTYRALLDATFLGNEYICINPFTNSESFEIGEVELLDFYLSSCRALTSIDTVAYKMNTFATDLKLYTSATDLFPSFPHYYLLLEQCAKRCKKPLMIEGPILLYDIPAKSSWSDVVFKVWEDEWVKVNEALPSVYNLGKTAVMKHVAGLSWILGGTERLTELHENGVLIPEKLPQIKNNWSKISAIPFEIVEKIACGEDIIG